MVTHDVVVVVVRLNQPQLCVNTIISRLRCVEGGICASQEHLHHCREMTGYLTGGSPMSRSTTSSTASVSVGLHTYKHRRSPAVNKRWENHMCWFVNLLTHKAVDMKIGKIARRVKKNLLLHTWKTKPQQPVYLDISWQESFLFLYGSKRLQPPAPMLSVSQPYTHSQSAQDNLMHDSMALKVGWINWKWLKMQNWQGNR